MSTELQTLESWVNEDVAVTSFSGGSERGRCVQLTQGLHQSVQLTERQALEALQVLSAWLLDGGVGGGR